MSAPYPSLTANLLISNQFPVHFTRGLLRPDNPCLAGAIRGIKGTMRCLCLVDAGFLEHWPDFEDELRRYFDLHELPELCGFLPLPGGEIVKDGMTHVHSVLEAVSRLHLCRHSLILAAGGGAFLDAAGFAAAIAHRGLRLLRIPTTALSIGDSGVGVKCGINQFGQKNFTGCFYPPNAVVCDLEHLKTLGRERLFDGIIEAVKVALVKDADFFTVIEKHLDEILIGDMTVIEGILGKSAELHLSHISDGGDPYEKGRSRPLDFGHWAAHEIENLSGYQVTHGEAVGAGMLLDLAYALEANIIRREDFERAFQLLMGLGANIHYEYSALKDGDGNYLLLNGLERFREHLGGRHCLVLPDKIGSKIECESVLPELYRFVLDMMFQA